MELRIYARRHRKHQATFKNDIIRVWAGSIWELSRQYRWFLRRFIKVLTHELSHMNIAIEGLDQPERKCKGEEWICELMEG